MSHTVNGLEIDDDLVELSTYHPPQPGDGTVERYAAIRDATMFAAQTIRNNAPECASTTLAIQHVFDARMRANAAIATGGRNLARKAGA